MTPRVGRVAVVLMCLVPCVFLPEALDRFVFPKLALAAVAAGLAWLVPATATLTRRVRLVAAATVVVLVLAAATSAAPLAQLIGRAPRYEGLVALPVYLGALWAGARLLGGPQAGNRTLALRTCVVACLAVAALAAVEATGVHPLATTVSRPGSLLGNATDEGSYGVLVAGLCLPAAVRTRDRWALVGLVAGTATVLLSASRGALAGLAVVLVLVLVTAAAVPVRRVVAGVAVAAVGGAFALPLTRRRLLLQSPLGRSTITGRRTEWADTVHIAVHHPALGVGPSGFVDAFPRAESVGYVARYGTLRLDSPHDLALQALAAGGVPLLLLGGAALLLLVRAGWSCRPDALRWGAFVGIAGYLVVLATAFTGPGTTPVAAFFAGGLLAVATPARRPVWWSAGLGVGAGLVWAVVLALAAVAEIPARLGEVAVSAGNVSAAARDFGVAHDLRPWDADLDAGAASELTALAFGGSQEAGLRAAPFAGRASQRLPRDPGVLLAEAGVRRAEGDPGGALRALDAAHRAAPDDPEILIVRGQVELLAGAAAAAVPDLRAVTALLPLDPQPWQLLERAYAALGDGELAGEAADTAVRLTARAGSGTGSG